MRHARQQRAERGQLLALVQRLALARDLGLRLLLPGQVEHAGDDRALALELHQPRRQHGREHGAVGAPLGQLEAIHRAMRAQQRDQAVAVPDVDVETSHVDPRQVGERHAEQIGERLARMQDPAVF